MKRYVLGFMFSENKEDVLLIKKLRPEWQKGKINGIGGKVEDSDNSDSNLAIVREFKEETGIETNFDDWEDFATMSCFDPTNYWTCDILTIFSDKIYDFKKVEEEEPVILKVKDAMFSDDVLPNLKWILPLCLDPERPYVRDILY